MTSIEIAFLCAIFVLYLSYCIHWVGHNEQAFTRVSATEWKAWKIEPLSFTLAGKMPVIAAPFLIRPGFIRLPQTEALPDERALHKIAKRLDRMYFLLTLCRAQAFLLLVYLPLLIVLHRLSELWPIFVAILFIVHASLSFLAVSALRRSKAVSWLTAATSIVLNPLGATIALDAISQAFFHQEQTLHSSRRSSRKA